jgi:hypothetical protein
MKSLEDGLVIIELSQWRIELDEKHVVDARVTDVVADGRDEERQCFKRL